MTGELTRDHRTLAPHVLSWKSTTFPPTSARATFTLKAMRRSLGPLLCELHAHTRWSDGELTVAELVDLHGRSGFDVLCVTDHVVRSDDPWREEEGLLFSSVEEESWPRYLADVEREAARAWRTYGMLVVPGLELTFNDDEPVLAAHAVAVGLREFVSVDDGIAEAMRTAAQAGAAIVAAHPNAEERALKRGRLTKRFSHDAGLRGLAHRFELFNRSQLFGWVAEAALPAVACGDFHTPEHLAGWKTLLPSRHDETSIVEYLRSPRPVYLLRLDLNTSQLAA
jgi:3',5'-nucleoside bisphosphate phosphatase